MALHTCQHLESQKCVQRATNHLDAKPMGSSVLRSNKTVFGGEGIAFWWKHPLLEVTMPSVTPGRVYHNLKYFVVFQNFTNQNILMPSTTYLQTLHEATGQRCHLQLAGVTMIKVFCYDPHPLFNSHMPKFTSRPYSTFYEEVSL